MELSQLRTLIHVAELGSLSKAADRLHIAQPALSRQIRLLEAELGGQLFDRHGRGMTLNDRGQEVLRHAYRITAELQDIRAAVADENAPLSGHVSIGMPPTVADILTVPLVSVFQERHPDVTLRIVGAYSSYLLDWLHKGEVDVAILFESKSARSLRSSPLLEEDLHLVGPADAGLEAGQPVNFADLAGETFLLPSSGHSLRSLLDQCARKAGIQLTVKVEADSFETLKNLVAARHGMTILPLAPIQDSIAAGRLSHAPLHHPVPLRRLMLSLPSDRPASRLAGFAEQTLITVTRDLVRQGHWPARLSSS
ncbi:LysR family transcriptional regulator [Rhodovibrionaceae bacterium A322]